MSLYPLSRDLRVVFFYNIASFTLWCCCLGRFLVLLPLVGRRFLPAGIADFFHVVATLPLIGAVLLKSLKLSGSQLGEISLWGFFNGIRLVWVCYAVIYPHPRIAKHTSYSFLISGWCLQNIVDLAYYAFKLKTRTSPKFLFTLHYNHFFVTFPISFASELTIVFLSLAFVEHTVLEYILQACFLLYVPVSYFTLKHLLQRRKSKYEEYLEKRALGRSQGQDQAGNSIELEDISVAPTRSTATVE